MSNNTGGWAPRKPLELTCPSGQKVIVRRPGPELMLKAGRMGRTFSASAEKIKDGADPQDVIAGMSDTELRALIEFAGKMVIAMVVSPRLVENPDPDKDEIGPKDIGNDFWFLFGYGMQNFVGIKVTVGSGETETEVDVSDLESFRGKPGVQGNSVDGAHVPPVAVESGGDQRLSDSA